MEPPGTSQRRRPERPKNRAPEGMQPHPLSFCPRNQMRKIHRKWTGTRGPNPRGTEGAAALRPPPTGRAPATGGALRPPVPRPGHLRRPGPWPRSASAQPPVCLRPGRWGVCLRPGRPFLRAPGVWSTGRPKAALGRVLGPPKGAPRPP